MTTVGVPMTAVVTQSQSLHVCSVIQNESDFDAVTEPFIKAGVAAGQAPLVVRRDQIVAFYGGRHLSDPEGLIVDFENAARQAVADGATGLCVAVDVTPLVTTPDERRAFAYVEHLADRMIRSTGLVSGMCCYGADVLSRDELEELAVLHEMTAPHDTQFHLCADPRPNTVRIDGELDLATRHALNLALTSAIGCGARSVYVDASGLEFADVSSLRALDELAANCGGELVLLDPAPVVVRAAELSELQNVRVAV